MNLKSITWLTFLLMKPSYQTKKLSRLKSKECTKLKKSTELTHRRSISTIQYFTCIDTFHVRPPHAWVITGTAKTNWPDIPFRVKTWSIPNNLKITSRYKWSRWYNIKKNPEMLEIGQISFHMMFKTFHKLTSPKLWTVNPPRTIGNTGIPIMKIYLNQMGKLVHLTKILNVQYMQG